MLTTSDKKWIEDCFRRIVAESQDCIIDAKEVAAIMGYKTPGMVYRFPETFGGWRDTPRGRWKFRKGFIENLARMDSRPKLEIRQSV